MWKDRQNMKEGEQEQVRQCNKMRCKGNNGETAEFKICNGDMKEKEWWKIKANVGYNLKSVPKR